LNRGEHGHGKRAFSKQFSNQKRGAHAKGGGPWRWEPNQTPLIAIDERGIRDWYSARNEWHRGVPKGGRTREKSRHCGGRWGNVPGGGCMSVVRTGWEGEVLFNRGAAGGQPRGASNFEVLGSKKAVCRPGKGGASPPGKPPEIKETRGKKRRRRALVLKCFWGCGVNKRSKKKGSKKKLSKSPSNSVKGYFRDTV